MDDKKILKELEQKRAELLYKLCEDESIYIPEIILRMVREIRSINKIIKIIKENG